MSKFGRYQAPEPMSALLRFHFHDGVTQPKPVDHEPKVAVLDQEDLIAQGIDVSTFIPGAPKGVNELGSCTANTVVEALSRILSPAAFGSFLAQLGAQAIASTDNVYADTVKAERAAIGFYHRCTDQTADSATEWPPTDCGSSGPYIEKMAQQLGLIKTATLAHGADNIVSLMQTDGVLIGSPWFNSWFEPDAQGFIDGDGSATALQAAIASGIAGGHEFYGAAIEKVAFHYGGQIDPFNTVLRYRNHWTPSFGDHGDFRTRLSTLVMLGAQVDIRQFIAA